MEDFVVFPTTNVQKLTSLWSEISCRNIVLHAGAGSSKQIRGRDGTWAGLWYPPLHYFEGNFLPFLVSVRISGILVLLNINFEGLTEPKL